MYLPLPPLRWWLLRNYYRRYPKRRKARHRFPPYWFYWKAIYWNAIKECLVNGTQKEKEVGIRLEVSLVSFVKKEKRTGLILCDSESGKKLIPICFLEVSPVGCTQILPFLRRNPWLPPTVILRSFYVPTAVGGHYSQSLGLSEGETPISRKERYR